jgi:hypothetical protein
LEASKQKTEKLMKTLASPRDWAFLPVLALLLAAAPTAVQAQQDSNQIALITLSSYDEIKSDVSFIGRLGGQPMLAEQMEGMLAFLTGGQGLAGLDKSKPLGVAVYAQDGEILVKAFVPVTDMNALIGLMGNWGVIGEEGEGGVMELTTPAQTLYAKQANGWAVISLTPEAVQSGIGGAEQLINSLSQTYDVAARIYVQNIPAEQRQMYIEQLRAGMEQGLVQNEGESNQQFEMRKTMTQAQVEQFAQLLEDTEQLSVGWSLDSREERTFLDFEMTAAPGTKMARQLAAYQNLTTDYAGFFQPDAAATLTFAAEMTPEDVNEASQMFEGLRNQLMQQIEQEADLPDDKSKEIVKAAVGDFFDAFVATVKDGKLDGGAVLNMSPDGVTLVAGGRVGDPAKIESGLKKLEQLAAQQPEFPGISWNADRHGEINFHTMKVPVPEHEVEARKLLGDTMEVAIGTGGNSAYFAVGKNAVQRTKEIIDASQANTGKQVPPMELTISLSQILSTVAEVDPNPVVTKVAEMLQSEAQGRDHIRMVEHVTDNGVKVRIELEEGVLRAIGTAVAEGQRSAQGGF